jgi:hypothetical protein
MGIFQRPARWAAALLWLFTFTAAAQTPEQTLQELLRRIEANEARIRQLEQKLAAQNPAETVAAPVSKIALTAAEVEKQVADAVASTNSHEHVMTLPGGPELKINGFADFNFGAGTVANPLLFPLQSPSKSAFQLGEFDLFFSSKIAPRWNFNGELVMAADFSNAWGLDIERLQLTYKASEYFSVSGGRFHSAIGYYNTAFHHGAWLQTAQGRPFMYYFEDSGGVLPVHNVGLTATGLVPGTSRLGLHWVAEVGNGRSTSPSVPAVQNFVSDRNRKSVNLAAYIQPEGSPGLRIGASYSFDRLAPLAGAGRVNQNIASIHAVFTDPRWEFLNEAVWLRNRVQFGRSYNSPLAYTQLSRKFGIYQPYVRYQYVNVPLSDPVNTFTGRYSGPSLGLRIDVSDYAAFKLQYNRIYQGRIPTVNGVNAQISFAF